MQRLMCGSATRSLFEQKLDQEILRSEMLRTQILIVVFGAAMLMGWPPC